MPPHSIGSGTISFGLVSIPIRMFTAASSGGIAFNQLHQKCGGRIRQQVMALEFAPIGTGFRVTVSLGMSFTADRHAPYDTLVRLADEALYAAKHKGRNRIEVRWHPA